jgi:phosphoribosylformylglycinamidine synthase
MRLSVGIRLLARGARGCWWPRGRRLIGSARLRRGRVAVTVAECCFSGTPGVEVICRWRPSRIRRHRDAFGESASRAVVSVAPAMSARRWIWPRQASRDAIGRVGGGRVRLSVGGRRVIDEAVDAAERIWDGAIASRFERTVA